ncbi:hypothetical protein GOODEAATRI_005855, partial [Goodea atripinnis]
LVIDLIVNTKNDRVFEESILLGIALLKGGNTQIQVSYTDVHAHCFPSLYWVYVFIITLPPTQNSFYNQLYKQKNSEKFFKVLYDRMRLAQQEIRSTVIAKHESNGIDIIIALIVNSINPLGENRLDLVLDLKNNASKLLLAIMESRHDSENAEKILYKMRPTELDFEAEEDMDSVGEQIKPRDVGHNIYILAHQIVRHDRSMEQIVFPVPNICEYLTEESKNRVFTTTERDDQGSKVNDFFQQFDNLYNEMRWQKKIRSECF